MVVEDQRAVIELLASSATHGGAPVERIETHSAVVFLAGARAWKLKRAVLYDYMDFSTAERRREMCEAEVRLNRRTAPGLYRGVVAVTCEPDRRLALGGTGVAVDWVIEMTRFDQRDLCDRRAAAGTLDRRATEDLASAVAVFHRAAARRDDHGGRDAMAWVVGGNAAGLREFGGEFLDVRAVERLTRRAGEAIEAVGVLLDARRHAGFVRQCHGDLHLRNIVMLDGRPTLFDAVEFNDELACIDTWYDVAFLLMDLRKRRLPDQANAVLNRYLADTGDVDGLAPLPLFLSCRAAIRAKTSATAASIATDATRRAALQQLSREYLVMAEGLLEPVRPALIAIGGLSGTGKSTLALALASEVGAAPGAVVLRSDEVRKELCGVPRLSRLGPEGYTADISARVYDALVERALRVLRAGHSVIVDAVYAREADRVAIERAAAGASAPFHGVWLDAPVAVLVARMARRRNDPSDADARVVHAQVAESQGAIGWRRLDAACPSAAVVEQARKHIAVIATR